MKGLRRWWRRELRGWPKANEDLTQEIHERKQAEDAYKVLADRSQVSIYIVHDRKFQFVNPQFLKDTGFSEDELLGMHSLALVHPEDREGVRKNATKMLKGERSSPYEYRTINKHGETRWIMETVTSILYRGGRATLGNYMDITERKQAEQEREALLEDLEDINDKLGQSNRELQDFAYIASHDLREPLRKISAFGTLLQASLEGRLNEDQQEKFEFMVDGALRMQAMIDDLLTYSRITTETKPFDKVDLNKVLEDLKGLEMATLLDETGGAIHIPEPLPSVQGDTSQMHQLLQNLIGNALKFHRKGVPPEITIRARNVDGNMVRVEVQDNGLGIDEQYHERIFTMFKRIHSREDYEGTGIGLAVCKKIVNRHGGDIGIRSTPGKGSTFWFTLPAADHSGDS